MKEFRDKTAVKKFLLLYDLFGPLMTLQVRDTVIKKINKQIIMFFHKNIQSKEHWKIYRSILITGAKPIGRLFCNRPITLWYSSIKIYNHQPTEYLLTTETLLSSRK